MHDLATPERPGSPVEPGRSAVKLPKVTLFACCACCVPGHTMRHSEACGMHQRAEKKAALAAARRG